MHDPDGPLSVARAKQVALVNYDIFSYYYELPGCLQITRCGNGPASDEQAGRFRFILSHDYA